jgi:hypothetical protein
MGRRAVRKQNIEFIRLRGMCTRMKKRIAEKV